MNNDGFKAWAVVEPGTSRLLHWVVYQREEDARKEAGEWMEPHQFEIKPIMRRMRLE